MELSPTSFIQIEGTRVQVSANSAAEAKLAIKELKLKKKEFGLLKREITSQQKEIRAEHSHEVATRGSKMRGGGGFGKFVRAIQTISRDSKRANVANSISPLEQRKQEIETVIHSIDSAIVQVEAYLLKHAG